MRRRSLFNRSSTPAPNDVVQKLRRVCQGLSAADFAECWTAFDTNHNGFIEGNELLDLVKSLIKASSKQKYKDWELLTQQFLDEFDVNHDGKIDVAELAQVLEPEEKFLALIRFDMPLLNGYDFLQAWQLYANGESDMEVTEFKNFLKYLFDFQHTEIESDQLQSYAESLMKIYDVNDDGKLSFKEVSKILSPQENYLLKYRKQYMFDQETFEKIFSHYDKDNDVDLKDDEIISFTKDLLETVDVEASEKAEEVEKLRKLMLKMCDKNKDGRLQKDELALWMAVGHKK